MEIKDCVTIITGGASGLGAATAKLLSEHGAKVALFDVNQRAASELATTIKGIAMDCDVTNSNSVEQAISQTIDKLGPIRICINCAGVVYSRRMVNQAGPMPLDEFSRIIQINLIGTFNVMRVAASKMIPLPIVDKSQERGIIINTASIAAFEGQIGQTAYSASKGGIVSLTLPAARELASFGIRVNAIAPGLVNTPLFASLSDEAKASLASSVPFPKRLAEPNEYAMLVKHLIENPMLNGTVIRLDGALRMQAK